MPNHKKLKKVLTIILLEVILAIIAFALIKLKEVIGGPLIPEKGFVIICAIILGILLIPAVWFGLIKFSS